MFAARVSGQSMEPGVPDGSWCLFRGFPGGTAPNTRQLDGRRVVVQLLRGGEGSEAGAFTLKRLRVDAVDEEGNAKEIELLPDNPKSSPIRIRPESGEMTVVAELLEVLS
jgi:SOS-response transcriptional repressor LexA